MTRTPVPLHVPDLARFARALRAAWPAEPGHRSVLDAVAKAAGYRNLQHLRAATATAAPEPAPDLARLRRAAARFDGEGRFTGWPARHGLRLLCLWPLWARLPAGREWDERGISAALHAMSTFRDAAGLRREMVGEGMLRRRPDGTGYRRLPARPGPTERALIALVLARVPPG